MSTDEEVSEIAEVDPMAALMWPWLLTHFDDWGRAKASPREIKNSVFQANELITIDHIKKALQLYNNKLLILYEIGGKWYMAIPSEKWFKFQTHIRSSKRETDGSRIPPPPDNSAQVRASAREVAEGSGVARDYTPSPSPSPSLSPSPSIDSSCSGYGEDEPNIYKVYEQEFGIIGSTTGDLLKALEEEYGAGWVVRSMKEAVRQNVRKISYVESTLKNWKVTGFSEPWTLEKPKGDDKRGAIRGNYEKPYSGIDFGF
jgi:DnaD/phage-associated family protein